MSLYSPYDEEVVLREGRPTSHPRSPSLSEAERLAARIHQAVEEATARSVMELRVIVEGDSVTLLGRCPSFHIKQKAQHAAMRLTQGSLHNEIVVAWRR